MDESLIAIIVIAVSIISSIVKYLNKKTNEQTKQYDLEEEVESPWYSETITKREIKEEAPEEYSFSNYVDEVEEFYKKKNQDESATRIVVAENNAKQNFIEESAIKDEDTELSPENNVFENFNLRDAVIYSEILKPKFDE